MSGAVYQAAAGALLQQMRMDMLSNNLANINTTGYKADRPAFRLDVSAASEEVPGNTVPGRLSPYAPPLEALTDFTPGPAGANRQSSRCSHRWGGLFRGAGALRGVATPAMAI